MSDTIYWAVKLSDISKIKLLSAFPPIHPNVYAEHMTISFRPSDEIDRQMSNIIGKEVNLNVIAHAHDDNGQAVVIESDVQRVGVGTPHITISCANGVGPVYSNKLLEKVEWDKSKNVSLHGVVAKFTKSGWQLE